MGGGSSFMRGNNKQPNTLGSQQETNAITNQVVSSSDGQIVSQRLVLDQVSIVAEYNFTNNDSPRGRQENIYISNRNSSHTPNVDKLTLGSKLSCYVPECGLAYTPKGEEAGIFQYYCPLCMQYYKSILKATCCGNYICFCCLQDFLNTKGMQLKRPDDLQNPHNQMLLEEIDCPHCLVKGFKPQQVNFDEIVRDYSRNFEPKFSITMQSPLRVGETFEDMKRKMVPFKVLQQSQQKISIDSAIAVETSSVAGIALAAYSPEEQNFSHEEVVAFSLPSSNSLTPYNVSTPRSGATGVKDESDDSIQRILSHVNVVEPTPRRSDKYTHTIAEESFLDEDNDELDETVGDMYLEDSSESVQTTITVAQHLMSNVLATAIHRVQRV